MPTIVEAIKMKYPKAQGDTIADVLKSINGNEVGDGIDEHILNGKGKPDFYYDPPCRVRVDWTYAPTDGFVCNRFDIMDGDTVIGHGYRYDFEEETTVVDPAPTEDELLWFNFPGNGMSVVQSGRFCSNDGLSDKDKFDVTNSGKPTMIIGSESKASVKTIYLFIPGITEETSTCPFVEYAVLTPVV